MNASTFQADRIFENKDFRGNVRTIFEKRVDNIVFQSGSLKKLEERVKQHTKFDNSGAAHWYCKGMYNGD